MIGLDFGTTNTCAALDDYSGSVRTVSVMPDNTLPYDAIVASTVMDPLSVQPAIGMRAQEAYRALSARERDKHTYLDSFKLRFDDRRLKELRYRAVGDESDFNPHVQAEIKRTVYERGWTDGDYSRDQLVAAAAALLSKTLENARAQGGEAETILLGIPVAFSSRARKRLMCALHRTGSFEGYEDLLKRVRFVLEPIAAAAAGMRAALDAEDRERVLVFDHGGGTLDLSLIEFERRADFAYPVPVRELAAAGAKDVAGNSIDEAFRAELSEDADIRGALESLDAWEASQYVKGAKEDLSTKSGTDLVVPGRSFSIDRRLFERALAPILGRIEQEIHRLVARSGLEISDVDRVLLTGGSSLVPAVQDVVAEVFSELAERRRVRRYDPADPGDVESAITEVAQGLVYFASEEGLERVVLWDVDLLTSENAGFIPVARRGDRYTIDENGRPEFRKTIEVTDTNLDGMALGLWEVQLDRRFFVLGLADVPAYEGSLKLEVCLRPDALYPSLRICDTAGRSISRDWRLTGWEADKHVAADLDLLPEGQLEEFFDQDEVDFLPDTSFRKFRLAPLTRPLEVGDRIEWTTQASMNGREPKRLAGEIIAIRRIGDHDPLERMTSLDPLDYEFTVQADSGAVQYKVNEPYGYIRVATRPEPPDLI